MADPFAQLVALERHAVSETTLQSYRRALQQCRYYLCRKRIVWNPSRPEILDRSLAVYLTHLKQDGADMNFSQRTYASVIAAYPQFSRHGSHKLPHCSRCLAGWRRQYPPRTRPPMPWLFVIFLLDWLIDHAHLQAATAIAL
eukprot:3986287-Amphidinium_carterae.1